MTETVEVFGPHGNLVGTLHHPGSPELRDVAVVLLNAGVIHRIGPHRINVKLARALGRAGVVSLRFDLSGQGDSRVAPDASPHLQQALGDVRAAMDHIAARTSIRRFVIAGICSGADHAYRVAGADPRVAGIWMMDGFTFPTRRSRLVQFAWRIRRRLREGAKALLDRSAGATRDVPDAAVATQRLQRRAAADQSRGVPSPADFARHMQGLVDRGVNAYLLYSGDVFYDHNYANQLRDAFRGHAFAARVRCDFLPEIDHTVTRLQAQRRIEALLVEWIEAWSEKVQARA
ncbi:MAG: hypothetical protein ABIQ06_13610 [Caldimonas sp.]